VKGLVAAGVQEVKPFTEYARTGFPETSYPPPTQKFPKEVFVRRIVLMVSTGHRLQVDYLLPFL